MQKTANQRWYDVPIHFIRMPQRKLLMRRNLGNQVIVALYPLSTQMRRIMRMLTFLLLTACLSAHASGVSQTVTLTGNRISLKEVFSTVKKQTGYVVLLRDGDLLLNRAISIRANNMPLIKFLQEVLDEQPVEFTIKGKTIFLSPKSMPELAASSEDPLDRLILDDSLRIVSGIVTSESNEPIAGASVTVKGAERGVVTDANGRFTIRAPLGKSLVISNVGYENYVVRVKGNSNLTIRLTLNATSMKDQVVTGIYQRKKESFSGSSSTYTTKDLKLIGNQDILQALKTLDPSFAIMESNVFGSDPNRLPDIEIRGKSSVIGLTEEFGSNPNQPLFILDGFESSLTVIRDLSMDRVESITLLKDAAATAIYGSKAANGVVVVETKKPLAGQLRLSYNLNGSFNFADLSDYNLMNAAEKLEYEKLSTYYGGIAPNGSVLPEGGQLNYNERFKEVQRGVNSFWPNEALRFAVVQMHTLFAEGGDANLRYSASLNYGDTKGVMKGSDRSVANGNVRLMYRKGRISFNNLLSVDNNQSNREAVPFSRYVRTNPYARKYGPDGEFKKIIETATILDLATFSSYNIAYYNPAYDLSNKNINKTVTQAFTNNFELEWRIRDDLRARGRVSVRKSSDNTEVFRSPFNTEFDGMDRKRQGSYRETNNRATNYDGDFTITYGKLLRQQHMINAVGGVRLTDGFNQQTAYQVIGFVDDEFPNPTFGFGFPEGGNSMYNKAQRKSASVFLNTGYAFNNRYLLDATVRSDGSSVYGADRQFTTIWSLGAAWNLHNEGYFKQFNWLNMLKIRGSIGNPGNQNFSDYISMRVYRYNNENRNPFGTSVVISNFGNKGLKWQKTIDRNVGIDVELFNRRLRLNADYFNKLTDPLLVMASLPSSTGTTTRAQNIGSQKTVGFTIMADYAIVRREEFSWRVNANMRRLKSTYQNIGNSLDKYNKENTGRNLVRYFDGASPSDLWAVRSKGIDPGTGREVFLNKNGMQTFVHSYSNETVVGNSDPKVEGVIGSSAYYKGFSLSVNLRYRIGGQAFMQTLYDKVENLSQTNMLLNQDKRALYDRWKKPGDNAKFKSISLYEQTPISSRFVEDNNILAGESISVGYDGLSTKWLEFVGASSITLRAYMNDIFRISTIKNERGLDYPFARSVSFSLGIRF